MTVRLRAADAWMAANPPLETDLTKFEAEITAIIDAVTKQQHAKKAKAAKWGPGVKSSTR